MDDLSRRAYLQHKEFAVRCSICRFSCLCSFAGTLRFFRGSPCQLLEFQTKVYARLDRNATLGERSGGAIDATVYKECVVACVGEVSSP